MFNNGAYAEYIRIPRRIVGDQYGGLSSRSTLAAVQAVAECLLACVLRGLNETKLEIMIKVTRPVPSAMMFVQVAKLAGCNVISVVSVRVGWFPLAASADRYRSHRLRWTIR